MRVLLNGNASFCREIHRIVWYNNIEAEQFLEFRPAFQGRHKFHHSILFDGFLNDLESVFFKLYFFNSKYFIIHFNLIHVSVSTIIDVWIKLHSKTIRVLNVKNLYFDPKKWKFYFIMNDSMIFTWINYLYLLLQLVIWLISIRYVIFREIV